jgi:AraC family transcriptional regulator, transcriptional activator of pobA
LQQKRCIPALKKEIVPILSLSEKDKKFFEEAFELASILKSQHSHFHINRLEDVVGHLRFPFAPHRQTVSDFIFITKGKSLRSKALDKYSFGSNTFFFLPAYQISTHDSMSKNVEGYYCHFDDELFNRKSINADFIKSFSFLQFNGNPLVHVSNQSKLYLLELLHRMEKEYKENENWNADLLAVNLLALFTELSLVYKSEITKENAAARITQQYKDQLSLHIHERKSVTEYAALLSVSPNHLNKSVKAITGKSAQELLGEMILLDAKVLLRQTTLSISEIAWKIGKEDPSDFIRFFKSKTGSTPTEYRKKN